VPWFWSDQYDVKLQIAGLPFDADHQVVRGDPASGAFAVFHLNGDRIVCVEAVNAPADFMGGRLLIGKATRLRWLPKPQQGRDARVSSRLFPPMSLPPEGERNDHRLCIKIPMIFV
jgi:hypothetical protein